MFIDNEWLRLRLIDLGYDAHEVHTHVNHCRLFMGMAGLVTIDQFESMVADNVIQTALKDMYVQVVKRTGKLDPIALCRWGSLIWVLKARGGDCFRQGLDCLREYVLESPEAQTNLAQFIAETDPVSDDKKPGKRARR